jgi:hypothetical protein
LLFELDVAVISAAWMVSVGSLDSGSFMNVRSLPLHMEYRCARTSAPPSEPVVDRLCNEWLDEESVDELLFLDARVPASRGGGYRSKLLSTPAWPSCSPHM